MTTRRALVLGATGVVGRYQLQHLASLGWDVVAVSRRKPDAAGTYRHLAVDLTDREQTRRVLGAETGITHVYFSAYIERPSMAEMVPPNLAMLENVMDAVEPVSPLAHINLMQGTKWYGSHLGPFRTPTREDDPRHMPPNFYYAQQDFVAARQQGKAWTWSAARPHAVCGFATGNPMNLAMVIAVYAAISKALGLPLRFPGSEAAWRALYQCTDGAHLAKGVTWMSTEPRCANQAFNLTNGDLIRWENLWPRIAACLRMETAPRQQVQLAQIMRDKGPVWDDIVARHGLRPIPYAEVAGWAYGDAVFTAGYDMISSMTKARQYGFHDVVDTEAMFARMFDDLRANRIIPAN